MPQFDVAIEGPLDEAIAECILQVCGSSAGRIYGRQGRTHLLAQFAGYNHSARRSPWLIIVDLDRDECAPSFLAQLTPAKARWMSFRIAVREIEAWLLADRRGIAEFLSVSASLIPRHPDELEDPKQTLTRIAGRSRRRQTREDIVPRAGSGRHVGPGYTAQMIDFVRSTWDPLTAAKSSPSLDRCLRDLKQLASSFDACY